MGKLLHATANLYQDSQFSDLVGTIPNVKLGISIGQTANVSLQNIKNNYNFFTNFLNVGEEVYLGGTFYYREGRRLNPVKVPNLWFPLCTDVPSLLWIDSYYLEYVFDNGYKLRYSTRLSSSGGVYLYNDSGAQIGYVDCALFIPRSSSPEGSDPTLYRPVYDTMVVSALDSSLLIPSDASLADYKYTGTYGTDPWGGVTRFNTSQSAILREFFNAIPSYIEETDPYSDIEPSVTGGGDGTYIFQDSDPIDFPIVPSLAAVNTGFVSLWSPTEQQMLDLSSYMWNANPLTIDFWKKLVADPKDLIFGLSLVPLNLEGLGYIDGQGSVVVGLINTGIVMDKVSSQWVQFDCGSVDIEEAWGAYLDYDPYTKLEIYLPFCGVHPIRVDDFTPGTISLKYYIDLLSGTCVAVIKSTKSNKHGDVLNSVVYQFMGNCAAQIPVTSQQFADAVRSAISIAASIGSMVAVGVGGAAAANTAGSASTARAIRAQTVSHELSTGASAVENVMNIKPAIERSGAIGSTAALLGVRRPYLILTRPRMARPDKQSTYTGYPSFITETLGDITGWTIVQAIHLEAIPCTSEEMSEIDELLKGGVIF